MNAVSYQKGCQEIDVHWRCEFSCHRDQRGGRVVTEAGLIEDEKVWRVEDQLDLG